jgi:hypothetical protein
MSRDVIPYALRHSSIVRAIRSGLPIRLVAALHETSLSSRSLDGRFSLARQAQMIQADGPTSIHPVNVG